MIRVILQETEYYNKDLENYIEMIINSGLLDHICNFISPEFAVKKKLSPPPPPYFIFIIF